MDEKRKYIDDIFHYTGKWEMPSHCGIMIRRKESAVTVILTELYETNPGSSVTDLIGILAGEIIKKHGITPAEAIFIVRNPERSTHHTFFAETFYRARMNWDGEKFADLGWEKINEEDVKRMI